MRHFFRLTTSSPLRHRWPVVGIFSVIVAGALPAARAALPSVPATQPIVNSQTAAAVHSLESRIRALLKKLNLSDDQQAAVDQIFQQTADQSPAPSPPASDNTPVLRQLRRRRLLENLKQQIDGVLNPSQRWRFDSAWSSATADRASTASGQAPALQRLRAALAQVQLDADQQTRVDTLLDDTQQKIAAARSGGNAQDRPNRIRQIVRNVREQLSDILQPDQLASLREKMRASAGGSEPAADRAAAGTRAGGAGAGAGAINNSAPRDPASADQPPLISPGQPAPAFRLDALDGSAVDSSTFHGHVVVLVFGSYSSPVFRDRAAALGQLWRTNEESGKANMFLVYTREAHPTGGWEVERNRQDHVLIPQPASETDRRMQARQCRDALHLSLPILVDTLDDATARAYGTFPDGAIVINRNGTVAAAEKWAEASALQRAIDTAAAAPAK